MAVVLEPIVRHKRSKVKGSKLIKKEDLINLEIIHIIQHLEDL